jgi:UDP-N-acetylglucosamine acyltransferase
MNQVYIAHDCSVGDGVTLASSVLVAGHFSIGRNANIGMGDGQQGNAVKLTYA